MKKLFFAYLLISAFAFCKKETTTPNNTINNTIDTTKTTSVVSISGFDCAGVQITGNLKKDQVASGVTATITYSGGNGNTYSSKSHNSTGVIGLTASLLAGTLSNGTGTLKYTISGTPTTAGVASFAIDFGGKTCTINITVANVVQNPTSGYGQNITDGEGNSYKTVYIGTQEWMAENLKVSKYNDGTAIPNVTEKTQWASNTTGAWCYYNNDISNNDKFGKLYNWYAVSITTNGNKNVCPTGWHVPTDAEWTVLINYLGGQNFAGGKMKEVGITNWKSPNDGATNSSLFSALPAGTRYDVGDFSFFGSNGYWWSSSEYNTTTAWNRNIYYSYYTATRSINAKEFGFSVRCIKD